MPKSRTDSRRPSPMAEHWKAVTRQVQTLALKAQQARGDKDQTSSRSRTD